MKTILRLLLVFPPLMLCSCNKESGPVEPPSNATGGTISTGTPVEVERQTIPSTGGKLSIRKPGNPLDGFELSVPMDAFTQAREFVVSYAEIKSHQLGLNFSPIAPMIRISYDGGYAAGVMSVKIPVKLPPGHFAMGFFYDVGSGKLEPVPLESLDSSYVTLSTRHLSPANATLGKRSLLFPQDVIGNLVVSSIQASLLDGQATLSSGFTPGVDDWEFPNLGSYVSSGGHCAGQAMTAMWYYYEKRLKGEPALYGRFDSYTDPAKPELLWGDNPRGYRFASTIQEDIDFGTWMAKSLSAQSWVPSLTFYSFIYAMLITGEPQFVGIRNSATRAGHAMIVYKVTPATGTLYIADPNYPGNRDPFTGSPTIRTIEYQNGSLKPYSSALFSGGPGTIFDLIGYIAKTSLIEWSTISDRWAEFQDGTIGNDRFPRYSLWVHNGRGSELLDTLSTDSDTLVVHCASAEAEGKIAGTNDYQEFWVYDGGAKYLGAGDAGNNGILAVPLQKGNNRLGFHIWGARGKNRNYVDFRWTDVRRSQSDIDFARVKKIGIGLLSVMTHWKKSNGDAVDLLQSPTCYTDVTFAANTLYGKSTLTGDSVWTAVNTSAIRFFGKTRQSLGSLGICNVSISGTISSSPVIEPGISFRYVATGGAISAVVDSLTINPGVSYTYVGHSFTSSSSFSIRFEY